MLNKNYKTKTIHVKVTELLANRIRIAAADQQLTISEYVRKKVDPDLKESE